MALGAVAVAMTALAPTGAGAVPEFTTQFAITPSEGLAGSTIAVTGRCLFGSTPADELLVEMYAPVGQGLPPTVTFAHLPVAADGTVSGSITVPVSFPAGNYILEAGCILQDMVSPVQVTASFVVTGGTVTTTTTTTDVTTSSPPRVAIDATPRFTG